MGLTTALNAAVSGLRTTQSGIEIVSQNVANQGSIGYARRTVSALQEVTGGQTTGVRAGRIERQLDALVQRQLRTQGAGAGASAVTSQFRSQLDQLFGTPGGADALDGAVNDFTGSLQALANNPASGPARAAVLAQSRALAQRINQAADGVQGLRTDAEARIAAGVGAVNDALRRVASTTAAITSSTDPQGSAALLDERDRALSDLSRLVDIRVVDGDHGAISVFTGSGTQLFGDGRAASLSFDARSTLAATSLYDTDPAKRGVGTITLTGADGGRVDLIAQGAFRSGEIAGLVSLRDKGLVEAQDQLDALAAGLSSSLSDRAVPGTAVTSGASNGFDAGLAGLLPGNTITLDYREMPAGTARRVTFVRQDAPGAPVTDAVTADPTDRVVRLDFTGGPASVAAQAAAALGPGFTVSAVAGALRVLDDGTGARAVDGLTATVTTTGTADQGGPELPLFVDGAAGLPFSRSLETGDQRRGLASRLQFNAAVTANALVVFKTAPPATPQGDATRPSLLLDRLTAASRAYPPSTGLGDGGAPFVGSVAGFARRVVESQGAQAAGASASDQGQQVVLNALQARFAEGSGVKLDQELADLVALQSAYAANARVVSVVKDLLDTLLRI